VFTGPGGGNGVPAGSRTMLSRYNFRRVYQRVVARAGHTTPEMAVRVAAAIQERLVVVVQGAEAVLELDDSGGRVF
jgi:hypothetical protein